MGVEASKARPVRHMEYCGFDISALPEELFMHVLLFVPAKDVVTECSLVNKYWLQVSRTPTLWRRKCEHEKIYVASVMGHPPQGFMKFYFQNPYRRNLLRNPFADGLTYWIFTNNGPITVEDKPYGANPIKDYIPADVIKGEKVRNWVTSYIYASMAQKVRLLDLGCNEFVLDEIRPPLEISAWCAARWDCGAKFQLEVKLLNAKGEEVGSGSEERVMTSDAERRIWHKVSYILRNYPPGVRSLVFEMGGVDTQFWAGNYGAKFTLPCVRFLVEEALKQC